MGDLPVVLLLVAVVLGIPWYLSNRAKKSLRERFAPVPPKTTKVVLDAAPAPDRATLLSRAVIQTGNGTQARYGITRDGASQHGIHGHHDPHSAFGHHGHALDQGHGHGDGHC